MVPNPTVPPSLPNLSDSLRVFIQFHVRPAVISRFRAGLTHILSLHPETSTWLSGAEGNETNVSLTLGISFGESADVTTPTEIALSAFRLTSALMDKMADWSPCLVGVPSAQAMVDARKAAPYFGLKEPATRAA